MATSVVNFPAPPQLRPKSSRGPSASSTISFSNKMTDYVEPSPIRSSRSSGINELATLSDIRLVCDYVACLRKDLLEERKHREKEYASLKQQIQRVYKDSTGFNHRENDKIAALPQVVASMQQHMENFDRSMTDLNSSIELFAGDQQYDRIRKWRDGSRTDIGVEEAWNAQCIFVLNSANPNVYEVNGVAYLKLQHGRPVQTVLFSGESSLSFVLGVEGAFSGLLKGRSWMPLKAQRTSPDAQSSISLEQLPARDQVSGFWNRTFLDEYCATNDMHGLAHIYIALQFSTLTLSEIQNLTVTRPTGRESHPTRSGSASAKNLLSFPTDPSSFRYCDSSSETLSPGLQSSFSSGLTKYGSETLSPGLQSSFSSGSTKHDSDIAVPPQIIATAALPSPRTPRAKFTIDKVITHQQMTSAQADIPKVLPSAPSTYNIIPSSPYVSFSRHIGPPPMSAPPPPPTWEGRERRDGRDPGDTNNVNALPSTPHFLRSGRRRTKSCVREESNKDIGSMGVNKEMPKYRDTLGMRSGSQEDKTETLTKGKVGFWKRTVKANLGRASASALGLDRSGWSGRYKL